MIHRRNTAFLSLSRVWLVSLALGCVGVVLVLAVLTASSQLHAALHAEAGQADHSCAITLFSHGIDTGTAQTAVVIEPLIWAAAIVARPTVRLGLAPHYRLLPGRAPPVC